MLIRQGEGNGSEETGEGENSTNNLSRGVAQVGSTMSETDRPDG